MNRGAGVGEAHGGAKTERGADCGPSGAAGGLGVATESVYPDNSREVVTIQVEGFMAVRPGIRLARFPDPALYFAITLPELYATVFESVISTGLERR